MAASTQTTNPKSLDASLWFDSFSLLLADLENVSLSADLPPLLAQKLKDNHDWFLNTVNHFKPKNQTSKEALNSGQVNFGSHRLIVKPELRDLALKLSSTVFLDEVQSYILVERYLEQNKIASDAGVQQFFHEILLEYYIERQCLLKCTRQIIVHALHDRSLGKEGTAIGEKVRELISDGLEEKLISILNRLLSPSYPHNMDVDLFILWAEETLIEGNLVLDILFLVYYESFCTCSAGRWKELCILYKGMTSGSSSFGKMGVSAEALEYCYRAKVQMLLILIETLDFECLLQMIHDELPLRDGSSAFSSSDIQDMDSVISSFDVYESKEAGPLILSWAVFLCLTISLPGKEEHYELMELDHIGYARQAFDAASLTVFLDILQSDLLKDPDGPVAGYRSILRTFFSAFIASYEISQLEQNTFALILTILREIYQGEESLCVQFWDKDSIIDGPIRGLLCNLESEFPYRTVEFIRFLSALSEGSWPAECIYNFLENSVGLSSLFEVKSGALVDEESQIVETQMPLQVPLIEGLLLPSKTRGQILKMIDAQTALVRWEYKQSGIFVLLLRLANVLDLEDNEEVLAILDLFHRLTSFNTVVCFSLMNFGKSLYIQTPYGDGQMESNIRIDVVEILCNLIRKLSPNSSAVLTMSMGVGILAKMLRCSPSHVSTVVMKMNILDMSTRTSIFSGGILSSGSWLLSGRLAKMLLIDCEQNSSCPLTWSVLDLSAQLLQAGVENEFVLALVIFCLQYVLVNHEFWKYKVKQDRWRVTLKVLEVLKISVISVPHLRKIGTSIRDIVLSDPSIHNILFRIIGTTSSALERLSVNRLYNLKEIEGLQLAISLVLDILESIFSNFSEDELSSLPMLRQAMLSSSTKLIPPVVALASLISYFRCPAIQVGAARLLSTLCVIADHSQPSLFGNASFGLDDKQVIQLRHSIENVILEHSERNEELFVAVVNLLASAARYQSAFLAATFAAEGTSNIKTRDSGDVKDGKNDSSSVPLKSENATGLLNMLVAFVERSKVLVKSNPRVLLSVLNFMKALWQEAAQYIDFLEMIKKSENFWKQMSESILVGRMKTPASSNQTEAEAQNIAYEYRCQSTALEIMALDMFLHKLSRADSLAMQTDESSKETKTPKTLSSDRLENILLSWWESSTLCELLKSSATCMYSSDIYHNAKIAVSLFATHAIRKWTTGNGGSLCMSFVEKIKALCTKLFNHPAFSELYVQYTQHGYSEGMDPRNLILNDLYYHLQGELEGRKIESGPFKELSRFLCDSDLLQSYQKKFDNDLSVEGGSVKLFDLTRLELDIGMDVWDYTEWSVSKEIAETMSLHLRDANSMLLIVSSRLQAIRALITILALNQDSAERKTKKIPKDSILSCIDHLCQELRALVVLIVLEASNAHPDILDFLTLQSELLLCLIRQVSGSLPSPVCLRILQTSSFCLKLLRDSLPSLPKIKPTMKFLLVSILYVLEVINHRTPSSSENDNEFDQAFNQVWGVLLGLLPILCYCTEIPDLYVLSIATIDMIVKNFSTPASWFPVIQEHLPLQHLLMNLQAKRSTDSASTTLKFLLTLSRVREGTEMLLCCGFLSSLRTLLAEVSDNNVLPMVKSNQKSTLMNKTEKPQHIWSLALSVLVEVISSLGETSACADIIDTMIPYFFFEKPHLIFSHLSAPDFPSDDRDKKRPRAQKRRISLSGLRETEHTLMLIYILAKWRNSWVRTMKETGPELREKIIHLLAFISRASHHVGDPPVCLPIHKEEFECCSKPAFVNSKKGWFAVAALGCLPTPNLSSEPGSSDSVSQTYFSDNVAVQIYRITFLLLKFLCLEAVDATRRAEELGFVDLCRFPELPTPEILHGVQDQAIAIVAEVCEANKSEQLEPEVQGVCLLQLKIMEMALYLEFCVSLICGIRPVLGRIEDFSKEIRLLFRAIEGKSFLKTPVKHLKHIISSLYPGLLQSEGII